MPLSLNSQSQDLHTPASRGASQQVDKVITGRLSTCNTNFMAATGNYTTIHGIILI